MLLLVMPVSRKVMRTIISGIEGGCQYIPARYCPIEYGSTGGEKQLQIVLLSNPLITNSDVTEFGI